MYVFTCLRVCEVRCCTSCVCAARSVCTFLSRTRDTECMITKESTPPFPDGSDHALSRPFLPTSPEKHERVPRLPLSPLMLPRSDCPVGFSQTRSSLKVSQPCGLKNDPLCSRPLRASSHLENRERATSALPTVSGGLRGFTRRLHLSCTAEAFTCPTTLDRPSRLDFLRSCLWDSVPGVPDSFVEFPPLLRCLFLPRVH